VAAADIREYYKTRHRWAHGNIRALRVESIFTCKGLSVGQRLSYLTLGLIYLEGWQQLLLFVVPWMSLLTGWAPFDITLLNVTVVLLFPVIATMLLQEFGCGLSRYWTNEIFAVARFPVHILASLALFSGKMVFRPSAKNIRGRLEWRLLSPQLVVAAVSLCALAVGLVHLALDFRVGPLADDVARMMSGDLAQIDWNQRLDQGYTLELVAVSGFWALFNAAKCLYLVLKAMRDARGSTEDYRFDVRLPLEIETEGTALVRVERLSSSFASARWYGGGAPAVGERLNGWLHLPSGAMAVTFIVTKRTDIAPREMRIGPFSIENPRPTARGAHIDCELMWRRGGERRRLAECLYSVDWHREFMHRYAFFATPIETLTRLFKLRRPFASDIAWSPALYRLPETGDLAFALVATQNLTHVSDISYLAITPGPQKGNMR
jgi:hypothetical protein